MFLFGAGQCSAQVQKDTSFPETSFTGTLGITNNGFSIIPLFSLNSPATITLLSWRKNKFSIDPDIRLSTDAKKGGILLWFRYHAVDGQRFKLRMGAHPAMNLQTREIDVNGGKHEISQMRRFLAWELAPSYQLGKHFNVGLYYLQGNGLQKDGPRTTHYINLSSGISQISIGEKLQFSFTPAIFYLYLDRSEGTYFTATSSISHRRWPFSIGSIINKTIKSNLQNNQDFQWNISLNYHFKKIYSRLK